VVWFVNDLDDSHSWLFTCLLWWKVLVAGVDYVVNGVANNILDLFVVDVCVDVVSCVDGSTESSADSSLSVLVVVNFRSNVTVFACIDSEVKVQTTRDLLSTEVKATTESLVDSYLKSTVLSMVAMSAAFNGDRSCNTSLSVTMSAAFNGDRSFNTSLSVIMMSMNVSFSVVMVSVIVISMVMSFSVVMVSVIVISVVVSFAMVMVSMIVVSMVVAFAMVMISVIMASVIMTTAFNVNGSTETSLTVVVVTVTANSNRD